MIANYERWDVIEKARSRGKHKPLEAKAMYITNIMAIGRHLGNRA
jgi:hypothetical protein